MGVHDVRADHMTVASNSTHLHGSLSPTTQGSSIGPSCRRIQVSREKRPLNFFVTLSKKFLLSDNVIELSGLGLAVTTVVTIAEILRSQGLVYIQRMYIYARISKFSNLESSFRTDSDPLTNPNYCN